MQQESLDILEHDECLTCEHTSDVLFSSIALVESDVDGCQMLEYPEHEIRHTLLHDTVT
jgi:hypothetical protein